MDIVIEAGNAASYRETKSIRSDKYEELFDDPILVERVQKAMLRSREGNAVGIELEDFLSKYPED